MMKVAAVFLIGIVALALFGRVRLGGLLAKPPVVSKPGKCAGCGRFLIGMGPCECGRRHG